MECETPRTFEEYEIIEQVGDGCSCNVYRVFDKVKKNYYAAKVIDRNSIESRGLLLSVEQELRVLSSVHHPHIVPIINTVFTHSKIMIIFPYYKNGDLLDFIQTGRTRSLGRAIGIICQVIDALKYLSDRNIHHKDIKPENILISDNHEALITDFGSCTTTIKNISQPRQASTYYAPPEFFVGKDTDDEKYDVWSIGVVFYVMLKLSLPWGDPSEGDLVKKIFECKLDLEGLNESCANFIKLCLNVDPVKRPTLKELMETDFYKKNNSESRLVFNQRFKTQPQFSRNSLGLSMQDSSSRLSRNRFYIRPEDKALINETRQLFERGNETTSSMRSFNLSSMPPSKLPSLLVKRNLHN